MKIWAIAGIVASGSMIVGAGIAVPTVIAIQNSKGSNEDTPAATVAPKQNVNELLKQIHEKIKNLPGNDHPTYKSFDEFEKAIHEKIEKSTDPNANLKSEIIEILNAEIDKVVKNVYDEIDKINPNGEIDFIKEQISQYSQTVESFTEQLKYGIVGEHDLNYFQDVLGNKVDNTIFASSNEELNQKMDDIKTSIDYIKNDIDVDIKKQIDDFQKEYEAFSKNIDNEIDTLKLGVEESKNEISKLTTGTAEAKIRIDALIQNHDDLLADFSTQKNEFSNHKKAFEALRDSHISDTEKLNTSFESMLIDMENMYLKINENKTETETSLNELKAFDSTLENQINSILNRQNNLDASLTSIHHNVEELSEKSGDLYESLVDNENEIANLKANLLGLTDKTDQITDKLNASEASLQNISNIIATIDVNEIERKIDDNKAMILEYGKSIEKTVSDIATVLESVNTIVERVDQNESKIFQLESLVASLQERQSSENVVSEYETLYNTGPTLLENKIYLSNDLNKYAKVDIVMMAEHGPRLAQVISFAPEKTRTSGVIRYRGNGAFDGWLMSLQVDFDFNNNSIQTKYIQLHGWGHWSAAKLQAVRGWLY